MKVKNCRPLFGILCLLATCQLTEAQSVADDASAYPGAAGMGWATAWTTKTSEGYLITPTVSTDHPLTSDGGSYFSVTCSADKAGESGSMARAFDTGASGISGAYQLTFDFLPGATPKSGDSYNIFAGAKVSATTFSEGFWQITGTNAGWYVYSGNGSGGGVGTDLGMPVVAGTVYQFTIKVNPDDQTWTATIDNGKTSVTSEKQTFRTPSFVKPGRTYIGFGSSVNSAPNPLPFSLDAISISALPKTSASALMPAALVGMNP